MNAWVSVLGSLGQMALAISVVVFILAQRQLMRYLIQRNTYKDVALTQALMFLKSMRLHMEFQGPADGDPIRLLNEQLEKAIRQ